MIKVAFVTIASDKIGFGHLKRCENLGLFLKKKQYTVTYKIFNEKIKNKKIINNKLFYPLTSISNHINEKLLANIDLLIFDFSNKKIFKKICILKKITKKFREKIIIFDSLGDDMINSKNILNYSKAIYPYLFDHKELKKKKNVKYYLGTKYLILPRNYKNLNYEISINKKYTILISCGGADVNMNTLKILKFFKELKLINNFKLIVIVGPFFSKKNIKRINMFKKNKNFQLEIVFSPACLSKFILKSNLAFVSSGLTKYEMVSVGLPTIVFCENNMHLMAHEVFAKKKITFNIGLIDNLSFFKSKFLSIVKNPKKTKSISERSKKFFDFSGQKRILKLINNTVN